MPYQPEWHRAWRHDEINPEERMARSARHRRRERAKQIVGDAMIVGAIVMFAWSMMPGSPQRRRPACLCPASGKAYASGMTEPIDSPDPHRGPYGSLSDDDLAAAYERVATDPDDPTGPLLLAELEHRGLATNS